MSTGPGLCLVVGAPRSGTTWLQRLLASSPHVASPQESSLFHDYLAPQQQAWRRQAGRVEAALADVRDGAPRTRVIGLPTLLTEDDLLDAQRTMVDRFLARAVDTKPGSGLVLEKTPRHSLCVGVVDRVCPRARFVHIVRDPRDVMVSLRDAATGWGRHWAPSDALSAARMWLCHVQGAREAAAFGPQRYLEMRYEDLRADPAAALEPVLRFLGLPDEPSTLVAAERGAPVGTVLAFEPGLRRRLGALSDGEPADFRGTGRVPLDRASRRAAEIVLGQTARACGYATGWDDVSPAVVRMWWPRLYAAYGMGRARRRWTGGALHRRRPATGERSDR